MRKLIFAVLAAAILTMPSGAMAQVVGGDNAPAAVTDRIANGGPLNVLANDTDVDGDPLTLVSNTQPDVGTATCTSDGTCTTTRGPFDPCGLVPITGDMSFTYTVSDGRGGTDVGTVRQIWVIACVPSNPPASLTLSPKTAVNEVGTEHCVTATVKDAGGQPVSGVTVRFGVFGVNTVFDSDRTTDAEGHAQLCYIGRNAGEDSIAAFADTNNNFTEDTGEPSDTASKTWTAQGFTLTLAPKTATNDVGTQHCVTATVNNAAGNPVAGVTVRFAVTGANTDSGRVGTTNAAGEVQFCYSGIHAGADTITAYADTTNNSTQDTGEPSDTASKTWIAPPRSVVLAPKTATNDVGAQHCVTATVLDADGNALSGVAVRFAVTGANTASGSASTTTAGQAQFCYTGTHPGGDTITAYADANANNTQDPGEPSDTAAKTWMAKAQPPKTITLTPKAAFNRVGTQHCVTATVRDAAGQPVSGVTVRFSVRGFNTASSSAVSDATGQARFCYTGTHPGLDLITAYADTNKNATKDAGEPAAVALKLYLPAKRPGRKDDDDCKSGGYKKLGFSSEPECTKYVHDADRS